ncbi:MAG TPA: tetratricopeptide repeat protein [Natronosporangium sp.]
MSEPGSAADPPDPSLAASPAEFVEQLRQLRLWAGSPSLRRLRQLAGTTRDEHGVEIDALPVSTASHVLRGERMPRMDFTRAFVTACLRARRQDEAQIAAVVERWHDSWLRLQQLTAGERTATPQPRPTTVPRQLPLAPAGFTGRTDEVALLSKALAVADQPDQPMIMAIHGPGGVGKSALALHTAHSAAADFPDGQLYVDLQGATAGLAPLSPLEVIGRFLRALGAGGSDLCDQLDEAAARFRTVVADRRVLIVLDNAADAGQVRPLLPGTPSCRVLVTSRQPLSGLDGVRQLHLDVLPEPEAITVLARTIGAERVAAEPAAAAELVRRCGGLPLALRIAAARLAARPAWPLAELAQRLADEQRRLDELRVADADVRVSIDVSYRQLRGGGDAKDLAAADAFARLGIWDGPDLPLPVAARLLGQPVAAAETLLERLVDAGLLESRTVGRYHFHDLVRIYARELAVASWPEPERTAALARALRFYTATAWHTLTYFRRGGLRRERADQRWTAGGQALASPAEAFDWLEAERANLLAAAAQAATVDELDAAAIQLAQALFGFFHDYRYWRDWEAVNQIALRVARRRQDPVAEAQALNDLGASWQVRGAHREAVEWYHRSLAIHQRLGDEAAAAATLNNLGIAHLRLGEYDQAMASFQRSLEIRRAAGDQRGGATVLRNLGALYRRMGRLGEAVECYQTALRTVQALGEPTTEATCLNDLGMAYRLQGRFEEALGYLDRGLRLSREFGVRWLTAATLDSIGTVHHEQGRYREALDCYWQSLRICQEMGSADHEADVLQNLGLTLRALGDRAAARGHWTEALQIRERLGLPTDELRALLSD